MILYLKLFILILYLNIKLYILYIYLENIINKGIFLVCCELSNLIFMRITDARSRHLLSSTRFESTFFIILFCHSKFIKLVHFNYMYINTRVLPVDCLAKNFRFVHRFIIMEKI